MHLHSDTRTMRPAHTTGSPPPRSKEHHRRFLPPLAFTNSATRSSLHGSNSSTKPFTTVAPNRASRMVSSIGAPTQFYPYSQVPCGTIAVDSCVEILEQMVGQYHQIGANEVTSRRRIEL
ncbi:hypothetical protein M422DRAFT_254666 [Sphaerobolus stellatus SS14]|uniref:Uncharacterized protein n=1 Tax=Sphaerobolus stellatus (strain SS14) TaxID=990650 RepID=A0A0C9VVE7_SPHS4|nr:hypothetical protein M422DRAFT_254666 [Sphaerobolus stellatus SS14]